MSDEKMKLVKALAGVDRVKAMMDAMSDEELKFKGNDRIAVMGELKAMKDELEAKIAEQP